MNPDLPADVARFPKIELHQHLDGSLRPETLLDLARQQGLSPPYSSAVELQAWLSDRRQGSLVQYLSVFSETLSVLQDAESLRRCARETVEDWAADGVIYGELRFAPELHGARGLSPTGALEAVLSGFSEGLKATGLKGGVIVIAMRQNQESLGAVQWAQAYRQHGVCGFDLAGPEAGYPPARHAQALTWARRWNLPVTLHAGEAAGPESMLEALQIGGARRLGHGTRLTEAWTASGGEGDAGRPDDPLTTRLRAEGIALECCLSSNVQTRACPSYESHPLPRFLAAGLRATLNTDNRLVSGVTLTSEFLLTRRYFGFGPSQWRLLSRNALASAFMDERDRQERGRRLEILLKPWFPESDTGV